MKKMLLSGIAGWMAFSMLLPVQAAEVQPYCGIGCCDVAQCFTDADNDGICGDHCFLDEDGDGICDNHCYTDEDGDSICDFFVDADSDGICDHCHEHGKPAVARTTASSGCHRSRGHHSGHHKGHQ